MQRRDPKPEIQRLEELAIAVKSGDIKLPRFQRSFVWRPSDMTNLLDSIYKGYPIGSLLVWNSSQRLTSERSILGLDLNLSESINYPTNYLLDGQQRLTTLCGALFWKGRDWTSQWNIQFDLDRDIFVHPKEPPSDALFPLNMLLDTSDFIQQCMKFRGSPKEFEYIQKAERLLRAFKDYKIAVVKIGDMTVDEVAPIFERINSTGRKLTMVDLMMAATWSDSFDLNESIGEIVEACRAIGFYEVPDQVVLKSIAAATGNGIIKEDVQKLRKLTPVELVDAASQARRAILQAAAFLGEELCVFEFSKLPYSLQFTYLAECFRLRPALDAAAKAELTRWLWWTSVTRYFTSANSGQISRDLHSVRRFAWGDTRVMFQRGEVDISRLIFDRFNLRNSSSTTFTMLLGSRRPNSTLDNRPIDPMYQIVKDSKFYSSVLPGEDTSTKLNIAKVIHPYPGRPAFLPIEGSDEHLIPVEFVRQVSEDVDRAMYQRCLLISRRVAELTDCDTSFSTPNGTLDPELGEQDEEEETSDP